MTHIIIGDEVPVQMLMQAVGHERIDKDIWQLKNSGEMVCRISPDNPDALLGLRGDGSKCVTYLEYADERGVTAVTVARSQGFETCDISALDAVSSPIAKFEAAFRSACDRYVLAISTAKNEYDRAVTEICERAERDDDIPAHVGAAIVEECMTDMVKRIGALKE